MHRMTEFFAGCCRGPVCATLLSVGWSGFALADEPRGYSSGAANSTDADVLPTPIVPYASTLYAPSRPEPPPLMSAAPSATAATPQAIEPPQVIDAGSLVPVLLPPPSVVEAVPTKPAAKKSEKTTRAKKPVDDKPRAKPVVQPVSESRAAPQKTPTTSDAGTLPQPAIPLNEAALKKLMSCLSGGLLGER